MPAQPQDRKPAKGAPFKFAGHDDGKTYTLPLVSKARELISGREVRDAFVGGDDAKLAVMFKMADMAGTPTALDALYDRPQGETLDILEAWGDHGDGAGASLGESSGSAT